MKLLILVFCALALVGCETAGETVREAAREAAPMPGSYSKGYGLNRLNNRRNPTIDDWNEAFASGGSDGASE